MAESTDQNNNRQERRVPWSRRGMIALALAALAVAGVGAAAYQRYVAVTRIAFIDFSGVQLARIDRAREDRAVRIEVLEPDEIDRAGDYPAVYLHGRGLQLDETQLGHLREAGRRGSHLFVHAATNPAVDVTTLEGSQLDAVTAYFRYGGTGNYARLLNFTRVELDGKTFRSEPVLPPLERAMDVLFHLEDDLTFGTVAAYRDWYAEQGLEKPEAPDIALLTSVPGPFNANRDHVDAFIEALESRRWNVYPVASSQERLEFLKEIEPELVILMPHGRLTRGSAQEAVRWLQERNIPMLTPVSVFQDHDDWVADQQGMAGGLLTLSVVLPELDGGVAPYAIAAQFRDSSGYEIFDVVPKRLDTFVDLAARYLALKTKPNRDKRVAIYYFKGPGKNAMTASNMEVAPSLFNLLRELRDAGYTVEGLPDSEEEFWDLVQAKGPVLGPYARGLFEEYVREGNPALVPASRYAEWIEEGLEPAMRDALIEQYGPAPGEYMTVGSGEDAALAIARVDFGNVVILPQPLPGVGEDTFRLIHGTLKAPPHPYVASYLWTRNEFEADAVMHFGTHGSLEFRPWKQIALSSFDWPDALIGGVPHIYLYIMSNIGEGIIAKRRSYAATVTHLTPPFMEAGLYEDLRPLRDRLNSYRNAAEGPVRAEHARTIRRMAESMNLHVDLGLEPDEEWSEEDYFRLSNHVETIDGSKVVQGFYTLGQAWSPEEADSTAELMALDPIAYSLAGMDRMMGDVTSDQLEDEVYFERRYRVPARRAFARRVAGESADAVLSDLVAAADLERARAWQQQTRGASDAQVLRNFMRGGGPPSGRGGGPPTRSDRGHPAASEAVDLEGLVARVLPHPARVEFLERLRSDREFARVSQILDPANRERADAVARAAPAMAEALDMAREPDVFALIERMQEPEVRERTLALLSDPQLRERAIEERRRQTAELLERALDPDHLESLRRAWDHDVPASETEELKAEIEAVGYYREQRDALRTGLAEVSEGGADELLDLLEDPGFDRRAREILDTNAAELQARAEREAEFAKAVLTIETSVSGIDRHRHGLGISTDRELEGVVRGLGGGYVAPSSGGDPIVNPAAVPTGRNLYSIDAEKTPSPESWKVGRALAESLLEEHQRRHAEYPKKVAFTLWPTDFIGTEGATIGQIFHLLGVEPVWDPFGRVADLRLVPSAELGRPRVDVVVQTAGQLRDLAASRLTLINRAVAMAAGAEDAEAHVNFVHAGRLRAEEVMKENGLSPVDARRFATLRVFGGVNGNYGTAIMEMVESGDRWETESEVAGQYLYNMGAIYDEGELWGHYAEGVFEAALADTEVVVQPRQSHTWGALSLDHVYEFMGGLSMAVRHVTGEDADAYFNDFRNMNRPRMTDLNETVWTEARATVLNPAYIGEMQEGGASSAEHFAETFRNTYGWNVMKPAAIDDALWDGLYEVYVEDRYDLQVQDFFRRENPYALQEMTAVMLETVRKGYWEATEEQIAVLSELHARLVEEFEAGCSGFVCDNALLASFIADNLPVDLAGSYHNTLQRAQSPSIELTDAGVVLSEEELTETRERDPRVAPTTDSHLDTLGIVFLAGFSLWGLLLLRQRRAR